MLLCVCSCVTLPVHRRQTPSTSSSRSRRASLVSSVKTRHISWSSVSGWVSEQGVCVRACLCSCVTRPAACGRSRRTSSSSGSSARRVGLEEARLVNLARQSSVFPALWQAIPVMIRLQRGCWRRRGDGAVVKCFLCCVSPGMSAQQSFPNSEGRRRRTALKKLSGSFCISTEPCYNTHGHVSVFRKALLVCLVDSYWCGHVVF